MVDKARPRQQQILKLLLEKKAGLSIDEVATALDISRNAVQQHFIVLERDGYIQPGVLNKTAGRPVRSFILTEAGINSFPKQYAWFSELMLTDMKNEIGSEAFQRYLHRLGSNLSQTLLPQFEGKQTNERIEALLKVMDSLGFDARIITDPDRNEPTIEARNCIYHDLAQKHEEICEFDRTLISSLLDKNIDHVECMAKGGAVCCFKIINK
ncbi:metalloregulator ArsR/SmtB family transcription factor [Methylobacter sp. S3L5C]|uniref:helix-turn-helix transcriptional regulator n=1 Tax=Methylobacter sp. S3L5C TaxID=2839024 RepID=UPI001FACFB0C|nr:HTH domain-containing protein [Methylobacter sp. S3L5C]UOA08229.1 winged helix-turn-helix transcriptional regulator [Methylobacter sp. S3L5C]